MPVRVITPPASEPVTLAEAKAHLRLETALDDAQVSAAIAAARQWVEGYCWRGLVTQTLELVLEEFPEDDEFELPRGNLASITSVKYLDTLGVEQTWAADQWETDTAAVPGFLRPAYGVSWPVTRDTWNAIVVRYVVGWAGADVPGPIKSAILLLVSHLYEQRTPETTAALNKVSFAVDALLSPYRLVSLA